MSNEVCPKCGSSEFGRGILTGAYLTPENKLFSGGNKLILEVCTECGNVLNMKVNNPHKFKK